MRCSAGIVLANLGALVTLTDLAGNLPLLQENVFSNGEQIVLLLHSAHGELATNMAAALACCFAVTWQHTYD